jgi:hypothetical protein
MKKLWLAWIAMPFIVGCATGGGGIVITPECLSCLRNPDPEGCALINCIGQNLPIPTATAVPSASPTAVPSSTTPGPTPAPTASSSPTPGVTPTYVAPPPPVSMRPNGDPIKNGKADITQHVEIVVPVQVQDEIPTRQQDPGFWNPPGAHNCDKDHWINPAGQKTILWWVCGGSIKFNTQPRDYDLDGKFDITSTPNIQVIYNPGCYRDDAFNYCVNRIKGKPGTGSVTVCLPIGGKTKDGIIIPTSVRCGTRGVQ